MQVENNDRSFGSRAISALGISIIADGLDYFAAPLFGTPIIGDIFDSIIISILYSITKSKSSTAINLIEFIPFVGDFIPVYTLSTLVWISKELRKSMSARTYYKREQLYPPKRNIIEHLVGRIKQVMRLNKKELVYVDISPEEEKGVSRKLSDRHFHH